MSEAQRTYPKPTPGQIEAYNRLVAGLAPRDVRLARLELRADRYPGGEASADIEELQPSWAPADGGFAVTQRLRVKGKAGLQADSPSSLSLDLDLVILYGSAESMSDELFQPFAALNLPVNMRPFLREAVANAAVRAGWPPLLIPAFVKPARALPSKPDQPHEATVVSEPKPRRRVKRTEK
jgi:hypothetical protein